MVGLQKQFPPMDNELVIILIKFDGPITSDVLTMFKKVISLIFHSRVRKNRIFRVKKHFRPTKSDQDWIFYGPWDVLQWKKTIRLINIPSN